MFKLGTEGKSVSKVFRRMLDVDLFVAAYTELAPNKGSLTKGTTPETVDGMSMEKIERLIQSLRDKTFRWHPVRRHLIPKKNGKMRQLGIPNWSDKLVQQVLKMVLESYYEPIFIESSHGFRPDKSCHTALVEISKYWRGMKWVIEGDIKGCFDNIPHDVILKLLGKRIKDNQILKLIKHMLKAGYMENGKRQDSYSGTPQGGIVSPLLANIVLHELDVWMIEKINQLRKGKERKANAEWRNAGYRQQQAFKNGDTKLGIKLRNKRQQLPSGDSQDEGYRRVRYVRYADDFVVGVIGSKELTEQLRDEIQEFLKETLGLDLSKEKTLITNLKNKRVRFLGYEFGSINTDVKVNQVYKGQIVKKRSLTNAIQLYVPRDVIEEWEKRMQRNGKPIHRNQFLRLSDFEIIHAYGSEWRGLYNYYSLAMNVHALRRVEWAMLQSCQKTLAGKHKTTTKKIRNKYESSHDGKTCLVCTVDNPQNPNKPLQAMLGGIPLRVKKIPMDFAVDRKVLEPKYGRVELTQRLLANECEICGSKEKIQVHHIKSIRKVKQNTRSTEQKPVWVENMLARRRNTLVVCRKCHIDIHYGH